MKANRQDKIIELISTHDVETQEELAQLLNHAGYQVTQATVSRDIKALHLKKVPSGKKSKYIYPETRQEDQSRYLGILRDAFVSMDPAATLVVIRTVSGMAMAAAAALDHLQLEEVVGTIAGDDTIMCATRSEQEAHTLVEKIKNMLEGMQSL